MRIMQSSHEGQLSKYTNVMKGWQPRWFIINSELGTLEYFVLNEDNNKKRRPKANIHLEGAVISPSDEDSQTFTVNSANGDMYKLRATDAKERQQWVNKLRSVAEYHTLLTAHKNPPLPPREQRSTTPMPTPAANYYQQEFQSTLLRAQQRVMYNNSSVYDAFSSVREFLIRCEYNQQALAREIELLPSSGSNLTCLDSDLLLLKAASQATILCMEQCLSILQQQQHQANSYMQTGVPGGIATELIQDRSQFINTLTDLKINPLSTTPIQPQCKPLSTQVEPSLKIPEPVINSDDEIADDEIYSDSDMDCAEDDHKSVILHLLSQLKLGMDLTRVVLPTFILERRSLLEMFADFMGHPDIFLKIADAGSPELRMFAMVEWYLTSFHVGRKGSVAKKPYNPIIGETFSCSWKVSNESAGDIDYPVKITYLAEQVSHHPPVSAFYVECPEKGMCLNAHVWTKSKFMGMSIGVNMIGEAILYLTKLEEEYVFQLPSAFARSILTVPWVELGGKVTISCTKTGYTTVIIFHTKPFYGGKLHRITAEIKNPQNNIVCRIQGEWNGVLEFIYSDISQGETKVIDTNKLSVATKLVRPLDKQADFESRKLWQLVTECLKKGDIESATDHKRLLEDCQRAEERERLQLNQSFINRYFSPKDDAWVYRDLLIKRKIAY
uniref:Oxysterol-binding protein n=1 Tax=Strigamia maritima TaxID=126957 RepID=T1JKI0_STRMM